MSRHKERVYMYKLTAFTLSFVAAVTLMSSGCAHKDPFINAAGAGDLNVLKSLQSTGQNINVTDQNGATALMRAIWSKKKEAAKYLIEAGADLKSKDIQGYDALLYAVVYGQHEIIDLLLDKGADIESTDPSGFTPLIYSVWQVRDIDTAKLLIKKGANVNAKDNEEITVLQFALNAGVMAIVVELVNAGAKIFEPTQEKARLFFIGDGIYLNEKVDVDIGNIHKYIANNMLDFADVSPGSYVIRTNVGYGIKSEEAKIEAKAGHTYYFKVMPSDVHVVSRLGGFLRFEVRQMEDVVAKDKIKALLKTTN